MTPRSSLSLSFRVEGKAGSGAESCVCARTHFTFCVFPAQKRREERGVDAASIFDRAVRFNVVPRVDGSSDLKAALLQNFANVYSERERFSSAGGISQ